MSDELIRRLATTSTPAELLRILADESAALAYDELAWPDASDLHHLAGELDAYLTLAPAGVLPLFQGGGQ